MAKRYLLVCLLILSNITLNAQEVISTQGESYESESFTIDFTIGETIIETIDSDSYKLTQGFHQGNLIVESIEENKSGFSITLFPNPVLFQLNLSFEEYKENYTYQIIDINGKILLLQSISSALTTIDVDNIASGIYFLNINDENHEIIESFKVIKTN